MPPAEESKVTESFFGTTFARAAPIKGLDGDEVTFFVFSDLPVRTEGLGRTTGGWSSGLLSRLVNLETTSKWK
ncbi:hypothetical protein JB92DRAFT_3109422 [Gautieria morchelliformis]|nr:hypothetical protein JB92DRAFT_3109422 [Gautieria morchelliformis]